MGKWRQAVELALSNEDITKLTAISRSRTERGSRVVRAKMLLAYRENPSFFAVGRAVGGASSDSRGLRRADRGLWAACGPRRPTAAW